MLNENFIKKKYFKKVSDFFLNKNSNLSHFYRFKTLETVAYDKETFFKAENICLKCGTLFNNLDSYIIINSSIFEDNLEFFIIKCLKCFNEIKLLKNKSFNKLNKTININSKKIKKNNNFNNFSKLFN